METMQSHAQQSDLDDRPRAALEPSPGTGARVLYLPRRRGAYERFVKPAFDRTVAAVLLVLLVPVLLVTAVAVFLQLGDPILLRQDRVGRGGRSFRIMKFRTMRPDRREDLVAGFDGVDRRVTHKSPDDPRLVPLGRFLRTWSLDELPQLVNVVRGDMSLVGPRPELVAIVDRYEDWQHRRHLVQPGITGLWQVTERGNGLMHERTDVDLEYVQRISLRTDLGILVRTVPAALGMRRGY